MNAAIEDYYSIQIIQGGLDASGADIEPATIFFGAFSDSDECIVHKGILQPSPDKASVFLVVPRSDDDFVDAP